ncbi:MAG: DUF1963 domain-containing protein [Polyangiaceae bacterium]
MHASDLVDAFKAKLRAASFTDPDVGAQMIAGLEPGIGIKFESGRAKLGQSKVGGRPHLPKRGFLGLFGPEASRWPAAGEWLASAVAEVKAQGLEKEERDELLEGLAIQMSFVKKSDPLAFVAQLNLAECKPFDFTGGLPDRGMLYLFSTHEETALGGSGLAVVHTYDGPTESLVEVDFPSAIPGRGRFVERPMRFGPTFLVTDDDGIARFDADDEETFERILSELGGTTDARLLGRPHFFDADLASAFDQETDALLLALSAEHIWEEGRKGSIYGEGMFFLAAPKGDLATRKLDAARVLFEGGT